MEKLRILVALTRDVTAFLAIALTVFILIVLTKLVLFIERKTKWLK